MFRSGLVRVSFFFFWLGYCFRSLYPSLQNVTFLFVSFFLVSTLAPCSLIDDDCYDYFIYDTHFYLTFSSVFFVYTTGDVGSSRNFKPKPRRYYYLLFVYSYEVEHEPSHCSQNELTLQSSNIDVS